jgi:CheY-like chemotaxis protein
MIVSGAYDLGLSKFSSHDECVQAFIWREEVYYWSGTDRHIDGGLELNHPSRINKRKRRTEMESSILDGKKILAVDDEPDVLDTLEEEIMGACPSCTMERATGYDSAARKLESQFYDVVILDIMGVRGFDLLDLAVSRKMKVAMLTAHALNPEALKRSFDMKARAYLPKDKLGDIVPFLEDVLTQEFLPGWRLLLNKLEDFFETWKDKTGYNSYKELREKIDKEYKNYVGY